MNFKKNGKIFTSKSFAIGPSSYERILYLAAVSQSFRNTCYNLLVFQKKWKRFDKTKLSGLLCVLSNFVSFRWWKWPFRNAVLEIDGADQSERSCEKRWSIAQSEVGEESYSDKKGYFGDIWRSAVNISHENTTVVVWIYDGV